MTGKEVELVLQSAGLRPTKDQSEQIYQAVRRWTQTAYNQGKQDGHSYPAHNWDEVVQRSGWGL